MNQRTIRGLTALFFLICFLTTSVSPISAAATPQWETVLFTPVPTEKHGGIITTVQQTFYTSLWHYSAGYWANTDGSIYIKDDINFDQSEELEKALDKQIEFQMPIPAEVKAALDNGNTVIISCDAAWGLDIEKLFYLDRSSQCKFDENTLYFKAYPRITFLKTPVYRDYISGLNKAIPFANPLYGLNSYSIFARSGKHLGAANNYINPSDPAQLPDPAKGYIHPSQIINNKGHLANGLKINVDGTMYDSDDLAVGYNTFQNAGAVGIAFWYPLTITFYRAESIQNDVEVTAITPARFTANQGALAYVTVKNSGGNEITTSLNFFISGIINKTESVTLKAGESKQMPFGFTAPSSGPITLMAEANKERAFEETNYLNNKKSIAAQIDTPIIPPETTNCSDTISWTETAGHKVSYSYWGSVYNPVTKKWEDTRLTGSYTCNHTFTYETKLTATHKLDPKGFKSGYGFSANVDCSISTRMVSNIGCGSWGSGRSPTKTPAPPTIVKIIMPWKVTNRLGTQPNIVFLNKTTSTSNTSKFEPAPNPISEIKAKKIYTPVELAGTKTAPKTHSFIIAVSGGGVNGVEFCKNITDNITINGDLYEDDSTGYN